MGIKALVQYQKSFTRIKFGKYTNESKLKSTANKTRSPCNKNQNYETTESTESFGWNWQKQLTILPVNFSKSFY